MYSGPPSFTLATQVCTEYNQKGKKIAISILRNEVEDAMVKMETFP